MTGYGLKCGDITEAFGLDRARWEENWLVLGVSPNIANLFKSLS